MADIGFGAFAPQGWKTELRTIDGAAAQWAKCREITLLAEELGYDSVWVYDHFHNIPEPSHEAVFECWTTMAALAEATSRIRLGQMVSCTSYRNPALTAKITSSIDVISGGRLDWGVGAGWYWHEYEAYDYPFEENKVRIGKLEDAVQVVKAMWTDPDATFDGEYFSVKGAQCDPKPLQRPHPAVWIGGGGEQLTLRVVARHADYSNFGGNPEQWAHKREVLQRHCKDVGRDEEEIRKTISGEVLLRGSEAEIRALVDAGKAGSLWNEPYDSWVAGNLVGTPEQVCEKVRQYVELGCTYFLPWCSDYPDDTTLRLLAEQVMPEFR